MAVILFETGGGLVRFPYQWGEFGRGISVERSPLVTPHMNYIIAEFLSNRVDGVENI